MIIKPWYFIFLPLILAGCRIFYFGQKEPVEWSYEEPGNGGFQKLPPYVQETPPGMLFVEGSVVFRSTVLALEANTIKPFYISRYLETNGQYMAYLDYVHKYYSEQTYRMALPDTSVWRNENLSEKEVEFLVANYLRNPVFADYPVVGLTPDQIENYAWWKTDRMNEYILVREGVIPREFEPYDSTELFTTLGYLQGNFDTFNGLPSLDQEYRDRGERLVRMEDGILQPKYRLLHDHEWALALLANRDSTGNFVETPRPLNLKRYDKDSRFTYLDVYPKKKKADQLVISPPGIRAVYHYSVDAGGVYGLKSGVQEMIKRDSTAYLLSGESPDFFNFTAVEKTSVSGFRLVMDCYAPPQSKRKPRNT